MPYKEQTERERGDEVGCICFKSANQINDIRLYVFLQNSSFILCFCFINLDNQLMKFYLFPFQLPNIINSLLFFSVVQDTHGKVGLLLHSLEYLAH